jgi:hypothetical protein
MPIEKKITKEENSAIKAMIISEILIRFNPNKKPIANASMLTSIESRRRMTKDSIGPPHGLL